MRRQMFIDGRKYSFFAVFIFASFCSLLYLNVPSTLFFELVLGVFAVLSVKRIQPLFFVIGLVSLAYILLSYAYVLLSGVPHHIFDFLLIYKVFFYLPLLSVLVGKYSFDTKSIVTIFRFALFVFALKYLADLLLFGMSRPSVFYENNFELMFLCLLFYLNYLVSGRALVWETALMILIFALAGSRSASIVLVPTLVAVYYSRLTLKGVMVGAVVTVLAALLAIQIFFDRLNSEGLAGIDRLLFFQRFLYEVKGWSIFDFLVGAPRISEMSSSTCRALSYYERLFSYGGGASCYSVILHSYLLRIIFDHGILGLVAVTYAVYMMLARSGFSFQEICVVLGIVLLNSLSVSAFNSIYSMLILAVYILSGPGLTRRLPIPRSTSRNTSKEQFFAYS